MILLNTLKTLRNNIIVRSSFLRNHVIPFKNIHSVTIEPIAECNLSCPFCIAPKWKGVLSATQMDLDLFKRIVFQFPQLRHIKLQGMGEPFLNDNLTEMISIASDNNIRTSVISNGTLLNPTLNKRILISGLSHLQISFDGCTSKTYEKTRRGAKFEQVTENIKSIISMRNQTSSQMSISMICLISNNNILEEVPGLIEFAARIGIDHVYIKNRLKIWKNMNGAYYPHSRIDAQQYKNYSKIRELSLRASKRHNIPVAMDEELSINTSQNPCISPWKSLYVSVEGKIVPCSVIASPRTACMGDLHQDSIENIWNNSQYKQFRKKISENNIPPACRTCYNK